MYKCVSEIIVEVLPTNMAGLFSSFTFLCIEIYFKKKRKQSNIYFDSVYIFNLNVWRW